MHTEAHVVRKKFYAAVPHGAGRRVSRFSTRHCLTSSRLIVTRVFEPNNLDRVD
jgi:hypothetical protein